jgi:hypothetical protein
MLRYAIADYLGRKPTERDLERLARRGYPRFAKVAEGSQSVLQDELRTAFNMAPEGRLISGGRFAILGIMALGIFLDDPERQLAEMKPHLADWWQRKGSRMVREGLQERNSIVG